MQGQQFWYQSKGHIRLPDFLLMIYTNLPTIVHRFGVIAFQMSEIAIFGYPSFVYPPPPTEGLPGTIFVKLSVDVNGWPPWPAPKIGLINFQISSKSVHFRRSYSRPREGCSLGPLGKSNTRFGRIKMQWHLFSGRSKNIT